MNQPAAPAPDFASVVSWVLDARHGFDAVLAGAGGAAAPCGLADDALVAATVQVESLGRIIDGLRVRVAGEVAARSAAEFGAEGLARSHNVRSVPKFLAAITGARDETIKARMKLASQVHTSMSLVGLPNLPRFPQVAEALARGDLGVDAATAITRRLSEAAAKIGFTEEVSEAEGSLVALAQQTSGSFGYSANQVDDLAIRCREHLDPDGAEPREADLHEKRYLELKAHRSGMTSIRGLLSPSMAAIVASALEPCTSPRIVAFAPDPAESADHTAPNVAANDAGVTASSSDPAAAASTSATDHTSGAGDAATDPGAPVDGLTADTRTVGQKRADALVNLLQVAAGRPEMPRLNGAAPTVNLHATLDDVVTGRGIGWIDGLTAPVPYSTVEALLCHGDVITTLFGEHGQVLQHGKTRRLFTPAQNRALAARDGGCVWPGCDAPPSWCESHHVDGWLSDTHPGGLTDIDNGALLCHFHHSNVHKTHWKLTIRNGTPHLIPPEWLDWTQTPRPCQQNRARQRTGHHPPGPHNPARHRPPPTPPPTRQPSNPPASDPPHSDPRPGHPQTGDPRPGQPQPGDPRPGELRNGHPQTGEPRNGHPRPGDPRPGLPRSDDLRSSGRPPTEWWLEHRQSDTG
ncbi:hypothetical protein B7R54_12220 [Subtercola boreus]|uniref:DUF222 domain-containing protein n=1 Tax=Subtercola boreus TaxID=120213 RepID=A0A3E0VIU8_9MICO|nr:DUF222 domain-containing protein [Subtercola boreus]RFA09882.1 hypothetical protein B7R54_12220 [Subtercola boreus]TQL52987.1 uncharacterized protein DUF222 [Subtercola boreus]